MVSSLSVLVASLCATNVDAFGEWLFGEKRVEIFNRRSAPMLWEMGEPARQYKHMAFAFALKQRNLDVYVVSFTSTFIFAKYDNVFEISKLHS